MKVVQFVQIYLLFIVVTHVYVATTTATTCGGGGCMDNHRINCNSSMDAPSDQQCCGGYACIPLYIPKTEYQNAYKTNECIPSSMATPLSSSPPLQQQQPPPLFPIAMSADTLYTNMSTNETSKGKFYYDYNLKALRVDFQPTCPFLSLRGSPPNVNLNYVPCSVVFYEGDMYFIYPQRKTCCHYRFPVWKPTWLCDSNATFSGFHNINGVNTTLWSVEWFTNFTNSPLRNTRNLYVDTHTQLPVRFAEDLDTGYQDFMNIQIQAQPKSEFLDPINQFAPCHEGYVPGIHSDKTCVHYATQTLVRNFPCDDAQCHTIP